ncbi:MAG: hypothetical protein ACRDKX_01800 [Solirubrobacterales bacterium]
MPAPAPSYRDLATGSRAARKRVFDAGAAPEIAMITDWEFRGWNTAWIATPLRIRKFVKSFFAEGPHPYGCNTPAEQNGLDEDWRAKPSEQAPKRFGFYSVEPPGPGPHPNAALLDYSQGRNGLLQPARFLRDYLVRVADSDDLLLGKAYLALGPLRLPVSYFVLERRRPLPDEPRLPRD